MGITVFAWVGQVRPDQPESAMKAGALQLFSTHFVNIERGWTASGVFTAAVVVLALSLTLSPLVAPSCMFICSNSGTSCQYL
jgi:hypothetical protein